MLKLIGDGVLAMFTRDDMAIAKRAALQAEQLFRQNMGVLNARRSAEGRPPPRPMSASMSAKCFTAISAARTGSISRWWDRRSTRSAGSPRCAARSTASYWLSAIFATASMRPGGRYLVSTGRFALRGIGRAQDLYTLDPVLAADENAAGYELSGE